MTVRDFAFLICLTTGIFAGLTGCKKKESISDIPQIGFISYENVYGTGQYAVNGILTISYQDGNGDIGLTDGDTLSYNFVVSYYEKQNGIFKQIDPLIPLSARIPLLTPDGLNKTIKGTITDTLILNPHPTYDTIQFSVFIYDRALNKSNVVTTPEIITRKP